MRTASHPATMMIALVTALAACEGSAGPTGPAGPAGPEGAPGVQGPPGTANVISGRVTLTESDWSDNTIQISFPVNPSTYFFRAPARYTDVAVPEITSGVYDDGAVLVWMSVTDRSPHFAQLPYRFFRNTIDDFTRTYDVVITEGNLRFLFLYEKLDPAATLPSPLDITQPDRVLRWVIIPPASGITGETLPIAQGADATLGALERMGFDVLSTR
ncbi:MAG: collagen-like protein [Gemmatimonadota bacterium]